MDKGVDPTRSQNMMVSCRRSLGRGTCVSGMRGSPRLGARQGRSGGREEADAAGSSGWNWMRRHIGSAELGNSFEQLAAVPDEADAEIL